MGGSPAAGSADGAASSSTTAMGCGWGERSADGRQRLLDCGAAGRIVNLVGVEAARGAGSGPAAARGAGLDAARGAGSGRRRVGARVARVETESCVERMGIGLDGFWATFVIWSPSAVSFALGEE